MSRQTIAEQMRDITGVGEDEISKSAAKSHHAVSEPKDGDKKRTGAAEKRPKGGGKADPDVPEILKGEHEDQESADLEDAAEHDNLAPPDGVVQKGMCKSCEKTMSKCMCKGIVKSTSVGVFANDLNGVTDDEISKSVLAAHEINQRRRKAAREGKLGF